MRSKCGHIQPLWLVIALGAIPHGVLGGDTPPVPSNPAPPVHPSTASANNDAPAPFSILPQPAGLSRDVIKGAWEGQACECFQVGEAWEQAENYSKAAKWYRRAAEQGYALAQANLAMLYEHDQVRPGKDNTPWLIMPDGRKVESADATLLDFREIVADELRRAKASGDPVRAKHLADRWKRLQADLAEAIHWYHQAARQGHVGAQYNLGRIYLRMAQSRRHAFSPAPPPKFYHPGIPENLLAPWETEASQNNSEAQYQLGLLHFHGAAGTVNLNRAARLWKAAADAKHNLAAHALAWLEAQGQGVALDAGNASRRYRSLAYHFLETAGHGGVRDAWLALGHLHLELATDPRRQQQYAAENEGAASDAKPPVAPAGNLDYRGALLMFERAAAPFKHTVSDRNATAIAESYGLPRDWLEAANPGIDLDRLSIGATLSIPGAPEDMLTLGRMALEGAGQPANPGKAAEWFASSIPFQQPDAHFLLGYLYHNGLGVGQNLQQARAHYLEAALLNHGRAQYNLGLLYYQGARLGAVEPGAPPARRFELSFNPTHKPALLDLLQELQFVDALLIRAGTVQYVRDLVQGGEVLLIESPNRNAHALYAALRKAFPLAEFNWVGGIEMPRDPLRHAYTSSVDRQQSSNERAWHWWRLAELNQLDEARRGREYLEKFIQPKQLTETGLMAGQMRQRLVKITQPRKSQLTVLPEVFKPKTWAAGFMVTMDGYLITSQDIASMGKRFRVVTETGANFKARVVDAGHSLNGFALLKVDGNYRFRPLPLASSRTVKEQDEVYVVGFKPLKDDREEPEACSILTHVFSTLGNQADSRFLSLTDSVMGDRLFLRFNKYADTRRSLVLAGHHEGRASVQKRSLSAIGDTLIAKNENLARAQSYGYRLAVEMWYDPATGQWSATPNSEDDLHFPKGRFVVIDGEVIRTPPPVNKLGNAGRPLLRLLAPTGLARPAEAALRQAFWESGLTRDSFQPGLRGMALLNTAGQAVAIHYPPMRPGADHDYPNFNTYDRYVLKIDSLAAALRQRPGLRLVEQRPADPSVSPRLRLTSQPGAGLLSYRPGAWTPPSAGFSLAPHIHPDPLVRVNLNACNLALECVNSPMLSRSRASLVLVQVAE